MEFLSQGFGGCSLPEPPVTYPPLNVAFYPKGQKLRLSGFCNRLCVEPFVLLPQGSGVKLGSVINSWLEIGTDISKALTPTLCKDISAHLSYHHQLSNCQMKNVFHVYIRTHGRNPAHVPEGFCKLAKKQCCPRAPVTCRAGLRESRMRILPFTPTSSETERLSDLPKAIG